MYVLLKNDLVIESSYLPIVAATDGDYFVSSTRRHYDPRPSSGTWAVEMDFSEESFCRYKMVNGKPTLINPPVPQAVSMRQARLALRNVGLLATVNSLIAGMTGVAGEDARIEWEFSSEVKRNQPLVLALGPTLNLTSLQLDALFIAAATL